VTSRGSELRSAGRSILQLAQAPDRNGTNSRTQTLFKSPNSGTYKGKEPNWCYCSMIVGLLLKSSPLTRPVPVPPCNNPHRFAVRLLSLIENVKGAGHRRHRLGWFAIPIPVVGGIIIGFHDPIMGSSVKVIRNVHPWPAVLTSPMLPPFASTAHFAIANPRPVPLGFPLRALLPR
jgi:hypothetical protein